MIFHLVYFRQIRIVLTMNQLRRLLRLEAKHMTVIEKDQIRSMRLQGVGYGTIARALGLAENTVHTYCRRNGLGAESKNTIPCKHCGKLIKKVPKRKPRKFCSDACRSAWWNSHPECITRKAVYEFTCACCGEGFTAYGNRKRKYCSHNCYIQHRFGEAGDLHG